MRCIWGFHSEKAQEATTNAQNALQEKTQSTGVLTYKTPAAMKQAIESIQKEMQSKIASLQADLNGAGEEATAVINKKISFIQEYQQQLDAYAGKSDKINEKDAPDFGKNVATLVDKIRRDLVLLDQEK
ncbi:hypothetical protein [Lewinella sp. LCG006]|uniref:hypothetical protein n=1 Tax=Lewinella sp. LCG006 TaxID=3231911 RepID=UPI00345F2FC3